MCGRVTDCGTQWDTITCRWERNKAVTVEDHPKKPSGTQSPGLNDTKLTNCHTVVQSVQCTGMISSDNNVRNVGVLSLLRKFHSLCPPSVSLRSSDKLELQLEKI